MSENSIEFSLSNSEQRDSWLNSGHRTLDADILWTNSATRCGIVGAGMAWSRGCHHIFEVPKMWQRGILHGRQSGTRSSFLLKKREDELVWMQRRKGAEQHAQGRRKRCGPERQKRSKAAHGQENRKAQQEKGVVERRSEEPSKC